MMSSNPKAPPSGNGGSSRKEPTVYLVDDDDSFLRSLSRLLRVSGFAVISYPDAPSFLKDLRGDMRGCLVTDLSMPGMDGLGLLDALGKAGSHLPVLFLSGQGGIPDAVQAIRGGAQDFLTKNASKEALLAAVNRAIARGEEIHVEEEKRRLVRQKLALLSDREREVLSHVVAGKLNKQIAAELGIHERTVKLHRTNLTGKLQIYSVAELTRLAQEAGISS
jgi:FixJ family two-component response regulator